jgi:hypothetical protein
LVFQIGKSDATLKRVHFHQHSAVELNNRAKHAVVNNWNRERIHVIFDYLEVSDAGVNATFNTRTLTLEHRVFQARRVITVLEPGEPVPAEFLSDDTDNVGDNESVATSSTRFASLAEFESQGKLSTADRKRVVHRLYEHLLQPEGEGEKDSGPNRLRPCERTRRDVGHTFRRYTTGEMKEAEYLTCLEYLFGRDKISVLFGDDVGLLRLIDDG